MTSRLTRAAAGLAATGLAAFCLAGPAPAGEPSGRPARIVSMNLCTDELLLRLADPGQIASVTWLSQDPRNSTMAEAARSVPANHGLAEEVARFRPDLVIAGRYTTRTTVTVLRRMGFRVVEFGIPQSLPEAEQGIRDFAAAVGQPERGEALVAGMKARLARIEPPAGEHRPGAFVLRPNGFTAGRGSLVDDILTRAGLDNLAARLDLGSYGQVPLETVILQGAEVLIVDDAREGTPSLATALLRHPAIVKLGRRLLEVPIPSKRWTCAGPGVVDAVERLSAATRGLRRQGAS